MVLKNRFISLRLIINHLWAKILWCPHAWFCLQRVLTKAQTWLRGSIPLLPPLIRQEGCQLWVLCCRLNSQTSPLNWTLELSRCAESWPCPTPVSEFQGGNAGGGEGATGEHVLRVVWKVTVKCAADSSSAVSVGSLERNVGCCDRRGGNGSLQNGLGGHRQSGEGVKR